MKTINKILLGMATVTTVLAPLAPKNLNVNINFDPPAVSPTKEQTYISMNAQCNLTYKTITDTGLQICEYRCQDAEKLTVIKTFRANNAHCPTTTAAHTKEYNR